MTTVLLQALTLAGIYGILSLSLNLQYGLTGLLNFGQILFMAVGAYTVAVFHFHGWPIWMGALVALPVGALTGLVLALPLKRLDDHSWALMTLAVAELFLAVVNNEPEIAGGTFGTRGIPRVEAEVLLPILVVVIAVVIYVFERIRRSQMGRTMRVAREDPVLLATVARNVFRLQTVVLVVGGVVGAISGVAMAHWLTFVSPDVFSLYETMIVWAMLIIGGRGNNYGAVFGAVLLQGIFTGTRYIPDIAFLTSEDFAILRSVLVGLLLVVVLILRPEGAIPERKVRFRVEEAKTREPAATTTAPSA